MSVDRPRVLFLALSVSRLPQVLKDVGYVLNHGGEATVLTIKAEPWRDLDERTRLVTIGELESRHPLLRGERVLIFRIPQLVYRAVRKTLTLVESQTSGPRRATLAEIRGKAAAAYDHQHRRAKKFHKERFSSAYRHVRPFILWRVFKRRMLPQWSLEPFDLVVVADTLSLPVGWHLARQYPQVSVRFELDETVLYARRGVEG